MQKHRNRRLEILDTTTVMNYTRRVSSMIWHIENSKIYQEEWRLTKYDVIRHLKLLVIQSMMNISVGWHQWSTSFDKKAWDILSTHAEAGIGISENLVNGLTTPWLESCKSGSYTHLIQIAFGVLILQTGN